MLYKGSNKIGQVYKGSTKIGQIYKGSTLIWSNDPYDIDEIVFESSTAGTYPVNITGDGLYEVYCIGGGGGGRYYTISEPSFSFSHHTINVKHMMYGGGSGSGFIGIININAGNYSVIVGNGGATGNKSAAGKDGGDSNIGSLITSKAGKGANHGGGTGGAVPTISTTAVSTTLNSKGNSGSKSYGGASLYNGYGAGGNAISNGTAGYVKIVYKGQG